MNFRWIFFGLVFLPILFFSCNKYSDISSSQLSGFAYIHDTLNGDPPIPMRLEPIFLNKGTDTNSYILQTTTDSAGHFYISNLGNQPSVLYSRFTKSKIEYSGKLNLGKANSINLQVYPVFQNGFSFIVTDSKGGPVPKYKIRVYTSRSAAIVDSLKYAYSDTLTNNNGRFFKYNVNPIKYFLTGKDSLNGKTALLLDSLVVDKVGLYFKIHQLKN